MARGQVELGASAARRGSRRHGPVPRGLGPRRASGRRAGQSGTRRLGSWPRGHGGRRRRVRGQVAARAARRRSSSTGSSSSACERRSRVRERRWRERGSGRAAAEAYRRRGKHQRPLDCKRVEVRWHGMLTNNSEFTKEKALGATVKADVFIKFSFLSLYSLKRSSWRDAKILIFCTEV